MEEKREISRRVLQWFKGGKPPPYKIELRITNKCNLRCLSCIARGRVKYDPSRELSKKVYLKIIKEANEIGVNSFHISGGGEPMCKPEITLPVMDEIKNNNLYGSLVTNGTLFTEMMVKKLVKIGWDKIVFSIDGPDAKTHDYLRGVEGTFINVTKAINLFVYWKNRLDKNEPRIIIAPVVSSQNYNKISDIIKLIHKLKADELFLQSLTVKPNKIGKKLILNDKQQLEFQEQLKRAKKLADKYNINNNINILDKRIIKESTNIVSVIKSDADKQSLSLLSIPCYYPWFFMEVYADGAVEPCGAGNPESKENIKEKSLSEVWHGKYFNDFRQKLMNKEIPSCCKDCCGATVLATRNIRKYFEINRV